MLAGTFPKNLGRDFTQLLSAEFFQDRGPDVEIVEALDHRLDVACRDRDLRIAAIHAAAARSRVRVGILVNTSVPIPVRKFRVIDRIFSGGLEVTADL